MAGLSKLVAKELHLMKSSKGPVFHKYRFYMDLNRFSLDLRVCFRPVEAAEPQQEAVCLSKPQTPLQLVQQVRQDAQEVSC